MFLKEAQMRFSVPGRLLAIAGISAMVFAIAPIVGGGSAAAPVHISVELTGEQENPPNLGPGGGTADLDFDEDSGVLTYDLKVLGVSPEEVTAAHIHHGAVGVNGPVLHLLSDEPFDRITGEVELSDEEIDLLMAGELYINIHSAALPDGFARGQIFLDEEMAIEASLQRTVDAWNDADVDTFLAGFTDEGIAADFDGASREEAMMFLPEFIGQPPISLESFTILELGAETAEVDILLAFGAVLDLGRHELIREGLWKIGDGETLAVEIPDDVNAVELELGEYFFDYDMDDVADGNFAFEVENGGEQFHEVVLVSIEEGIDFEEALQSEEGPPEGIEPVAQAFFAPGEGGTMVFTEPLENGRYGMVCFVPDAETEVPHAFLGMFSEFEVTDGGGTVTPPSTGDAGLATQSSASINLVLLAAGLVMFIAGGTLAFAGRRS
jgi:hypothetical protein